MAIRDYFEANIDLQHLWYRLVATFGITLRNLICAFLWNNHKSLLQYSTVLTTLGGNRQKLVWGASNFGWEQAKTCLGCRNDHIWRFNCRINVLNQLFLHFAYLLQSIYQKNLALHNPTWARFWLNGSISSQENYVWRHDWQGMGVLPSPTMSCPQKDKTKQKCTHFTSISLVRFGEILMRFVATYCDL